MTILSVVINFFVSIIFSYYMIELLIRYLIKSSFTVYVSIIRVSRERSTKASQRKEMEVVWRNG